MINANTDIGVKVIAQIKRNFHTEIVHGWLTGMKIEMDESVNKISIKGNDGKEHNLDLRDTKVEVVG